MRDFRRYYRSARLSCPVVGRMFEPYVHEIFLAGSLCPVQRKGLTVAFLAGVLGSKVLTCDCCHAAFQGFFYLVYSIGIVHQETHRKLRSCICRRISWRCLCIAEGFWGSVFLNSWEKSQKGVNRENGAVWTDCFVEGGVSKNTRNNKKLTIGQ